ncbi:MAG: hypothetical protein Fur0018_19960 [Anaerolineales bacterium]
MQQNTSSPHKTRTSTRLQSEGYAGIATTILSITAVVLLLGVTFAADWLRAPELTVSASQSLISPNGDRDRDVTTLNYTLSDDATVRIDVLDSAGRVVRTLLPGEIQPAGQGFITWDGTSDSGQRVDDGLYQLQVAAQGAVRQASRSALVEVDTTPPVLQLVNLPDGMRVGESLLEIQGITEPGAQVWLTGLPDAIVVDAEGRFRLQYRLQSGLNALELRATDQAGNTARLTRDIELVVTPPDILVTAPPDQSWFRNPIVTVRGQASPGTTVTVNNHTVAVAVDGGFAYDVLLDEGENVLRIIASDDVGNLTTVERNVYIKTSPPALNINLTEGEQFVTPVIALNGTTDPGTTIVINRRVIPVGPRGDFNVALNLSEGENLVEIAARDQAGNVTSITRRVTYALPTPPSVWSRMARNLAAIPSGMLTTGLGVMLLAMFLMLLRRQQPVVLTLSTDRQTFAPTRPGGHQRLTINLDVNRPANITLRVLSAEGQPLLTLVRNRRRSARQHRFFWDGYDQQGEPVTPGLYTIQATARALPSQVTSVVQVQVRPAIQIGALEAPQVLETPAEVLQTPPSTATEN